MYDKYSKLRYLYQNNLFGCAWFSWYEFNDYENVLLLGDVPDVARKELKRKFKYVRYGKAWGEIVENKFSAVLIFGGLGRKNDKKIVHKIDSILQENGALLWVVDNKIGTRFICGDKHFSNEKEYYTLQEWHELFKKEKLSLTNTYYLLPGWHFLTHLYSLERQPTVHEMSDGVFKYVDTDNVFRDEPDLVKDLIKQGIFTHFANAFLFEYNKGRQEKKLLLAKLSPTKGRGESSVLMQMTDGVYKKPLYTGGNIEHIYRHGKILEKQGLNIITQIYENNTLYMPYINAPLAAHQMKVVACYSKEKFYKMLDLFWQCILKSSDITGKNNFPIKNIECAPLLKKAYIDMVPTNAFWLNDGYVFFDQEYCYENFPAKFVFFRALLILYNIEKQLEKMVPLEKVKSRYNLNKVWNYFLEVENYIIQPKLQKWNKYEIIYKFCSISRCDIIKNRNISYHIGTFYEYNLFDDMDNKRIVLFGAGKICDKYLDQYGKRYIPVYIVDNDKEKWGTTKKKIKIYNPRKLLKEKMNNLRVIICSSYTEEIEKQLNDMNIIDYRIY